MIRVLCKGCDNHDLFGTDKKEPLTIRKEVASFYKIPIDIVSPDGRTIQYCRYCNDQTETDHNWNQNVDGKRNAAISKKKGLGLKWVSFRNFTRRKGENNANEETNDTDGNIRTSARGRSSRKSRSSN
jgi:hypothetical protein